jgi:tRNA threonylcarbamoyl adenosine modification protein YeaZ
MARRLILALDGATGVCSAALLQLAGKSRIDSARDDAALEYIVDGTRAERDGRGQAKLLLPMIDSLLSQTAEYPGNLGAVVVGVGPGTFTGVRIAVATGRALSLALRIPVVGVGTLGALAAHSAAVLVGDSLAGPDASGQEDERRVRWIVPVVDARRGQVFYARYERLQSHYARRGPVGVCDRSNFAGIVQEAGGERVLVVAEREGLVDPVPAGIDLAVQPVGAEWLVAGQRRLEEPGDEPAGCRLDTWLDLALRGAVSVAPEQVKPLYVRSPDADIHITKMRDPWAQSPAGETSSRRTPKR